jgi:hypothetical protein
MTPEQIRSRLAELEGELMKSGNPLRFTATQAYKRILQELDNLGFKRHDSVYMVYKAKQG